MLIGSKVFLYCRHVISYSDCSYNLAGNSFYDDYVPALVCVSFIFTIILRLL